MRPFLFLEVSGKITFIVFCIEISENSDDQNQMLHSAVPELNLHCLYMSLELGPVVESILTLTSSLRGQLVKCFKTL